MAAWEFSSGTPRLVSEGCTRGVRALEILFDPGGRYRPAYMTWRHVRRDWSEFDTLELDVTNPGKEPIPAYALIADQAWADKGRTYWNRHNESRTLPPGRTTWIFPVKGLYRGEAGSRNNDIRSNIDPHRIVRLDFGFGRKGSRGRVIVDALRLVRAERPAGVYAFDFGPPSQGVMPGWTPVSNRSLYTKQRGWGWGPRGGTPWDGAARDTTFGPVLTRDFCEATGYSFHIDVPPGTWHVFVVYENSGYWGGEQARQKERRILAGGKVVWHEERPDGSAHALYRFEDVEPVGKDIWGTYMQGELVRPHSFDVVTADGGLTLRFESDRVWGSKISALAVYRSGDTDSAHWVMEQWGKVADEFRQAAVCLDKPAAHFTVPASWKKIGLVAWGARIEDTITPNATPAALTSGPSALHLEAIAVLGEFEPFCLAVRPLRDLGVCRLGLHRIGGPGTLPARVCVVYYNTGRGFGNIAWHTRPHTLRERSRQDMPANITRECIVTVHVPEGASAGTYSWAFTIQRPDGSVVLRVPLRLTVYPVRLARDTDFLMGFYGLMPPALVPADQHWAVLERTLGMLWDHGMNAVSGGPNWRLTGWNHGKPRIDFGEMDAFFTLLRKYGFSRPINGYGGVRFLGISDRYEKGRTGAKVEKDSGLPYPQALHRAWEAVARHARQARWPTIFYAMCDETRVRETAERQLAFMKIMQHVSAAFPEILQTSGSYSVTFKRRSSDPAAMLYWHQRFFDILDISALNNHDESVMAEARRLGREVHIYNQGRTRYSFGLYQWSEYRKGVHARWQWHLNILYGYQFFDLDAREPDTAMICYGRHGLYPTIDFERCREGAEDFYLLNGLQQAISGRMGPGKTPSPAVRRAKEWLDHLTSRVGLNQRRPPAWYDAVRIKAQAIAAVEAIKQSGP